MKNKLKFLVKHSLSKKIGTKWFKVVNVLLCILIIAMMNIDRLITLFGGDFENVEKIYVVDNINKTNSFENILNTYIDTLGEDVANFKVVKTDKDIDTLKKKIKDTDDIIITLNTSPNYLSSEIYTYDNISTVNFQILSSVLNNLKSEIVLTDSGLSQSEITSIISNAEITTFTTNEDINGSSEAKDIISTGLILIFIIPFFIFIVLLTQMIGAEINDEKSTRSMEIIISNVPPKYHFISKILSSSLFVLIQGALVLGYGILAFIIKQIITIVGPNAVNADVANYIKDILTTIKDSGALELLLKGLPFIIVLFLLNILVYAILAGVLASMTTNIEDYQQLQTPIMIIMIIGYYIALMASVFEGSLFVKIVSYIPMLSALVAPTIYMLNQSTIIDLLISIITSAVTVYFFFIYGLKIYKVGILNYSSSNLWKKIFKSLKEK